MATTYGVQDIKDRYGVNERTVYDWIGRGLLPAIDVRRTGSSRPKFRVTAEALAAFERARGTAPEPKPKLKRRRPEPARVSAAVAKHG